MAALALEDFMNVSQEFEELAPVAKKLWYSLNPIRAVLRRLSPAMEKDFVKSVRMQLARMSEMEKRNTFDYLVMLADKFSADMTRGVNREAEFSFGEAIYIIGKKLKDWVLFEPRQADKHLVKVVRMIEWLMLKGLGRRAILAFLLSLPPAGLIFLYDNRTTFSKAYTHASTPKSISVKQRVKIFKDDVSKLRLGKVNALIWLSLFAMILSKQKGIKISPADLGTRKAISAVV